MLGLVVRQVGVLRDGRRGLQDDLLKLLEKNSRTGHFIQPGNDSHHFKTMGFKARGFKKEPIEIFFKNLLICNSFAQHALLIDDLNTVDFLKMGTQ